MNEASNNQTEKPTRAANVTLCESAFGGGQGRQSQGRLGQVGRLAC
jgi:hypothetical protein